MKIAVDFDEVLFPLVLRMMERHETLYGVKLDYDDFRNYRFNEALKVGEDEASNYYLDFALSEFSIKTLPLAHAFDVLLKRKTAGDRLFIASSSQVEVVESKQMRLDQHFPGIFEVFHAANHYSMLGGPVRSKRDICLEIEADVMIDDNPRHLLECVGAVKYPILLGDFPWNKGEFPTLIRARDWREVDQILDSRT